MGRPRIELSEIKQKLKDPRMTVAEIAASFGITRQALYERIRSAGIDVGKRKGANPYKPRHSRAVLSDLYEGKRLTISEVADCLGTTVDRVRRELKEYDIKRRSSGESRRKHPLFSEMDIGEAFELPLEDGQRKTFSYLYRQAKQAGVRIVIRRKDATTVVVIRTRELSRENVERMRGEGMTITAIAKEFYATVRTISRLLSGKSGSPDPTPGKQNTRNRVTETPLQSPRPRLNRSR